MLLMAISFNFAILASWRELFPLLPFILLWERRLAAIRAGDGAPTGMSQNLTCGTSRVQLDIFFYPDRITPAVQLWNLG
jgi:hypothetical protein